MVALVIVSTDRTEFNPRIASSSFLQRRKHFKNGAKSPVDTSSHTSSLSDYLEDGDPSSPKSILKVRTQALSLAREYATRNIADDSIPQNQSVGFGSITISSHDIILGDNPAVSKGLPITIAWKPWDQITLESVLEYEEQRIDAPRRSGELVLPASMRETMLSSTASRSERTEMAQQIAKIQSSRRKNSKSLRILIRRHFGKANFAFTKAAAAAIQSPTPAPAHATV
jgi:hypothetical protein